MELDNILRQTATPALPNKISVGGVTDFLTTKLSGRTAEAQKTVNDQVSLRSTNSITEPIFSWNKIVSNS